jgi:hypothetical protein
MTTEEKIITKDSIITITVKTIKRRNLTSWDKQMIYWRTKKMNDIPTPKYGSLKNICNYFRVTEDEVFQIISEESIKEKRFHHYWKNKIGLMITVDEKDTPDTVGKIESVDDDGMINVLWNSGERSSVAGDKIRKAWYDNESNTYKPVY